MWMYDITNSWVKLRKNELKQIIFDSNQFKHEKCQCLYTKMFLMSHMRYSTKISKSKERDSQSEIRSESKVYKTQKKEQSNISHQNRRLK